MCVDDELLWILAVKGLLDNNAWVGIVKTEVKSWSWIWREGPQTIFLFALGFR